ncbi:MAG: two-component regulator propeller domain-containing protein [Bacteroidota bacterium]
MRRLIPIIVFLLVFLLPSGGQESEIRFHQMGVEDGLTHSLVTSIAEDSLGFIWISTQDGLCRFDGYEFKTYFKGKNKRSPSDSWIKNLYIDQSNQLWITYGGSGIERFDPYMETFHFYQPDSLVPGSISSNSTMTQPPDKSTNFFEDSDGHLWIGTDNGLNLYNRADDSFTVFSHNPTNQGTLSDNRIMTLFEDQEGYLWIGTSKGLNRMDRSTGEVKRYLSEQDDAFHLNDQLIICGFSAPDGSIWVGTSNGGLNIIEDPNDQQCKVFKLVDTPLNPNLLPSIFHIMQTSAGEMLVSSQHGLYRIVKRGDRYEEQLFEETRNIKIFQLLEDSNGSIWVASNDLVGTSLFRLSQDTRNIEVFGADKDDPYRFGGGRIHTMFESRTGLLWVGTESLGIYRVNLNARNFRTIDNHRGRGLFITNNEVFSIFEDDKQLLYIGTKTELNRINLKSGTTRGYGNQYNLKRGLSYETSGKLDASLIGVMKETSDGKIWMGSFDYKVSLYDPVTDQFLNFHHNEQDSASFKHWSLRSICITREEQVYFGGTNNGLCQLSETGTSFDYFPVVATGNNTGTNDPYVRIIYEDSDGLLWLGTHGGLNSFDPERGMFRHFVHDPGDPSSLSHNRVRCILEPEIHDKHVLWMGTKTGGLNRFDRRSGEFSAYTMEQGLPSNTIHGIIEDKVGDLWISTNRGLVQFDPITEKISIYTAEDGLVGDGFNEGAYFKNSDGIMYFGGLNGISYFDPEEIKKKTEYDASLVFTGFSISNQPVLPFDTINGRVVLERSIQYTDQITLTHKEQFISFEFASLDMAASGKIKYQFMLDGLEDSWNEVDADHRFISYTNLPKGTYTLKVVGSTSDGTVFRKPSEIVLNILPPFWQTSWFRLLTIVTILFLFLLILQIRTRILENQKKILAREVEERTHDLKEANRLLEERSDEIQSMAEKLHKSDQMKLKFFTNISHEFRTPLTLLLGPTEKLLGQDNYNDIPSVKLELELMYRNERRLFKLINQLLEVRRVETGNLELAVAEDDLVQYLEEIHRLFMPYAEKKCVDFRFHSESPSATVLFDADKIEKIFYNLLSNAFKHTPVKGEILFSMEKVHLESADWMKISVKDSGPGIPEKYLPHIFDRFYQVTNKHQSARISSGIGLSLSKDLVEKHHGRIEVYSTQDEGTRFEVYLPGNRDVYRPDEILIEPESDLTLEYISSMLETYEYTTKDPLETPLVGEDLFRILVVEDNPDLQKFLYNEMSDTYNVMVAQNGKEGLSISGQNLPDLIISDIMMPEMDGFEFCKRIKEEELTSHIPVILLTAKTTKESQVKGFESGADDYITKPFNPGVLKLKVRNILESRKQLSDKFLRTANYIPENIKISQIDQGFLEKFVKLVEDNIDNSELSGDILAGELGMSKGNLYKKLKTLTGMTVNIYVRTIRLKVAARLLKQGKYNISEVAYSVGFNNPKYFSTCFSEMYSVSPKEYMK